MEDERASSFSTPPGRERRPRKNAEILSFTDVRQEGSGKREFPVFYEKERKSEPKLEIPIGKKIPDRNQPNLSPHYETHFQATDTDGHEPAKTRQGTSYVPIQHRSMMMQLKLDPVEFWYNEDTFADGLVSLCRQFRFDGILVSLLLNIPPGVMKMK